jgi:hypothetical protein
MHSIIKSRVITQVTFRHTAEDKLQVNFFLEKSDISLKSGTDNAKFYNFTKFSTHFTHSVSHYHTNVALSS